MTGSERISKRDWYARGGLSNPRCWRRHGGCGGKRRGWRYYYRHD